MNSIGERKYFNEIDVLKGIAILTVVLEHSFSVKYVDLDGIGWCYHTVEVIKSFNMQLFFAVSGFLFANSDTSDLRKSYRSKTDRLLVPMIFLSIINLILMYGFPAVINHEEENTIQHTIISYIVYGESYWFIYTLFIIFCILLSIKKKLSLQVSVIGCIILIIIKELRLVDCNVLQLNQVMYMAVFFIMGYYMYVYYDKVRTVLSKAYIILPTLVAYIALYILSDSKFVYDWILPSTMSVMIWGGVVLISDMKQQHPVLEYLGRYSLQFYMFNGYALVPARIICSRLLGIDVPFLLVAAVFLMSLIILYVLTEVTKRIPVVSYLCGFGRKK